MSIYLERLLTYANVPTLSYMLNIPRSTLYAYRVGRYMPSPARAKQLLSAWRRVSYSRLRAAGLSTTVADAYKGSDVETIEALRSDFTDIANQLAQIKGIEVEDVIRGMQMSKKSWKEIYSSPEKYW